MSGVLKTYGWFINQNSVSGPTSFPPDDCIFKKEWNTYEEMAGIFAWAVSRN